METRTTSIKQIIDRVKRHPKMEDLNEEYIIDYAVEFIGIMGIPGTFAEKYADIDIEENTGKLPDDCLEVLAVRSLPNDDSKTLPPHPPVYYRYATALFHTSPRKYNREPYVYKVQGNMIYTSTEKCRIEILYRALDVDECGFPLLPDDSTFLRALESYIKMKCFTMLFDEGKLAIQILQNAEQDYAWNVGGVGAAMRRLTPDKVESIANIVKANIIRDMEHHSGYAHVGRETKLNIQ